MGGGQHDLWVDEGTSALVNVQDHVRGLFLAEHSHHPGEFTELGLVILVAGNAESNAFKVSLATSCGRLDGWVDGLRATICWNAARLNVVLTLPGLVLHIDTNVQQALTVCDDGAVGGAQVVRNTLATVTRLQSNANNDAWVFPQVQFAVKIALTFDDSSPLFGGSGG